MGLGDAVDIGRSLRIRGDLNHEIEQEAERFGGVAEAGVGQSIGSRHLFEVLGDFGAEP
jgi:hypothetical protein